MSEGPPEVQMIPFGPFGPPSPEVIEQQEREQRAAWDAHVQVHRFAAIFCSCRLAPRWSFGAIHDPQQVSCVIHGMIKLRPGDKAILL